MAEKSNPGLTDSGIVGERAPVRPDADQTNKYRTSGLSRTSAVGGAKLPLARVSAAAYPNLSRVSQVSAPSESGQAPRSNLARSSVARAQQELARRSATLMDLSITISIEDNNLQSQIVFKQDGDRFSHSQYTIKMVKGHSYRFTVQTRAEVRLLENIGNIAYLDENGSIKLAPFALEGDGSKLSGSWTCSCKPSSTSERNPMELRLVFDNFGEAVLPLNTKVYGSTKARQAQAGLKLKSIFAEFVKQASVVQLRAQKWVQQ